MGQREFQRTDPFFNLKTPVLFAHRGGVREAPESTKKAFLHAKEEARAEILELDVQLAKDGEIVVWHGPGLDNVLIEGQSRNPKKRSRRKIHEYAWSDLDGKAWVADPWSSLAYVPREDDRRLLLLAQFLREFPDDPLNIELKSSFACVPDKSAQTLKDNVARFLQVVDEGRNGRPIIVVSAKKSIIQEFRRQDEERQPGGLSQEELDERLYPTNLTGSEQLSFIFLGKQVRRRADETSYPRFLSGARVIRKVRESGGATYVFITAFGPFRSLDKNLPDKEKLFAILDRGVDGIMTDRPKSVREIIDGWKGPET
jgi:glycerophosphoryl diester phosphodiesterase